MKSPLADRIRPTDISEVVGQKHLLSEGKPLRKIIESGNIPNLIFYGPSGVGKTTLASIIAKKSGKKLYKLNATTASTADIREMLESTNMIGAEEGILLYLDEIQYFNKKQQQILEAEGQAEAILKVQTATAEGIRLINEAMPSEAVLRIKALEAFSNAANGKATKIIIPSEIQGLAGLAAGVVESLKEEKTEA